MQTTYIMTEESIDFIYSCITFPNLSQTGQPPRGALGGAVPCQAIQTSSGQAGPPAHITIPCSLKAPAWTPYPEFTKSGINHIY